jgi:hypothetical protein
MTDIRGCNLPDDLYYLIEKHVWAKPIEGGLEAGRGDHQDQGHRAGSAQR